MNDTVVIVTGGEPLHPRAVSTLPPDAVVIAADGGLDHARTAGLSPSYLVGDLDSISPEGLSWAQEHTEIERHPTAKDLTDTELAIAAANDLLPERLVLVAGGGDRLDHTIAAVGALGAPELTSIQHIELWWGDQHGRVLHGPANCTLRALPNSRLSALALHGPCTGVGLRGTRWELVGETIEAISGRGISNVVTGDGDRSGDALVHVRVSLGVLTVFFEPVGDGHPINEAAEQRAADDAEETAP